MIRFRCGVAGALLAMWSTVASAGDVVDEVRVGGSGSFGGPSAESGVTGSAEIYFDPFRRGGRDLTDLLLSPRLQFGASAGQGPDQVYTGLNWHIPLSESVFFEVGAGGTMHNGSLDSGDGPNLGCRLLFREHAAVGLDLLDNLRLAATVDHSSSAGLCDGPNDGLTHAGLALGIRF
ncbi:MAG TPA: acyloxyacyl hydrolase [Mycoplana sp.]|nr:acyloxyacyl hydrolase [Mycoplana sp.]